METKSSYIITISYYSSRFTWYLLVELVIELLFGENDLKKDSGYTRVRFS